MGFGGRNCSMVLFHRQEKRRMIRGEEYRYLVQEKESYHLLRGAGQ
jgi:hypothetical protein